MKFFKNIFKLVFVGLIANQTMNAMNEAMVQYAAVVPQAAACSYTPPANLSVATNVCTPCDFYENPDFGSSKSTPYESDLAKIGFKVEMPKLIEISSQSIEKLLQFAGFNLTKEWTALLENSGMNLDIIRESLEKKILPDSFIAELKTFATKLEISFNKIADQVATTEKQGVASRIYCCIKNWFNSSMQINFFNKDFEMFLANAQKNGWKLIVRNTGNTHTKKSITDVEPTKSDTIRAIGQSVISYFINAATGRPDYLIERVKQGDTTIFDIKFNMKFSIQSMVYVDQFVTQIFLEYFNNEYPIELWSEREMLLKNKGSTQPVSIYDISRAIKKMYANKDRILNSLNITQEQKEKLNKRLNQMVDVADKALLMEFDRWKSDYVDQLTKHIIGLRKAGVSKLLPKELISKTEEDPYPLFRDEKGNKFFGNLQFTGISFVLGLELLESNGYSSIIRDAFFEYMKKQDENMNIEIISQWITEHGNNPWNPRGLALKAFYQKQRLIDPKEYHWGKYSHYCSGQEANFERALKAYKDLWVESNEAELGNWPEVDPKIKGSYREQIFQQAFTIWHAFIQEILLHVSFTNNNRQTQTLHLIRADSLEKLRENNITAFGKNFTMNSSIYECTSLLTPFYKKGGHGYECLLEMDVPYHRIIHLYFTGESRINENEVIAIFGPDQKFDYVDR